MARRFDLGPGGVAGLALVLLLAVAVAWASSRTPHAQPADAPADRFSAERAMADIGRLAREPHPSGSPAAARVRDALMARLSGLGLAPRLQRIDGVKPFDIASPRTYRVENVIGRVAGRDPAAPALVVMSHYDSVPGSPGAADDMAGVASALEIARLLKAGPAPARDVVFLFTDGEEIGLNGASAYFADPAAVRETAFVLNMEARGGGGRALMFQTDPQAGGAVRLFAAHARLPMSDSLMAYLYERMPNDTDLTVSLGKGVPGLNYAFMGRPALYHTAAATPQAVEPGAVQSLGGQVYAMVQALAFAPALPARAASPTWFDAFGLGVLVYDPVLGWAPLLAAMALIGLSTAARLRSGEAAPLDLLVGAGQSLGATLLAAGVLFAYGRLSAPGHGAARYYHAMAHAGATEVAAAAAILACGLLVFRAGPTPARPCGRWAGALALACAIAVLLQVLAPRTAFLAEWPTLIGAAALAMISRMGPRLWTALVLCAAGLGGLLELWHAVVLGIGVLQPAIAAALAPLGYALMSPWLQRPERARAPSASSALV